MLCGGSGGSWVCGEEGICQSREGPGNGTLQTFGKYIGMEHAVGGNAGLLPKMIDGHRVIA